MTTLARRTLAELCDPTTADAALPLEVSDCVLRETPPPHAIDNLAKLARLGILNGDTVFALIAQAPIDPVNLMGTLMQLLPQGWAFSAIDFSMMRVLAQNKQTVSAAMHVDLMSNVIKFLARNRAGQLVAFKDYAVEPGPETWKTVQALMAETVAAAAREAEA